MDSKNMMNQEVSSGEFLKANIDQIREGRKLSILLISGHQKAVTKSKAETVCTAANYPVSLPRADH